MREAKRVELPLTAAYGGRRGSIAVTVLPASRAGSGTTRLVNQRADERPDVEPVQLLEGAEYRYSISVDASVVTIEPREVIFPDDESGLCGRLRPGLHTGRLVLKVSSNGEEIGSASVEVRSVKLNYLDEYRWMLGDIANVATELALQRFAASEQRLRVDPEEDVATLYQRFCFLRGIIAGGRAEAAIAAIVERPYLAWERSAERVSPGRGVPASSQFVQELRRPGPRVGWSHAWHPALRELPSKIPDLRFVEDPDNVPNRFVRFVLEEWRARVAEVAERLREERIRYASRRTAEPAAVGRGLIEVAQVEDRLEQMLDVPPVRDATLLTHFPGSNQVLQRRDGYRDIRELYALSEFAGAIEWDGGEDVFGGGQRNVATLYEYWVFLQLAQVLAELTAGSIRLDDLVTMRGDGLALGIKSGRASTLAGVVERGATRLRVEVSFNREFRRSVSGGSWTQTMRPDCSILVAPEREDPLIEPVSLHFDAKYRLGSMEEALGGIGDECAAHPDDLLKMHAYRDAILRAIGAYVIFPGSKAEVSRKFGEIVPGLGAFPLGPGPDGAAIGRETLYEFLDNALDHVAARGTRRARASFWHSKAYSGDGIDLPVARPLWLHRPPADAIALFAYVKNDEHLDWIRSNRLYNLRADARRGSVAVDSAALRTDVLFLYGPALGMAVETYSIVDAPRVQTASQLSALGYPDPGGEVYFVLDLAPEDTLEGLNAAVVEAAAARLPGHLSGGPFCVSFHAVLAMITSNGPPR